MIDWDQLRFFLAVARQGSMSRAARALAVAQPTVGRRLAAFEESLGTRLFARTSTGLQLTPAGRVLLASAERIEQEAIDAERRVAGRDAGVRGTVRITTNDWLATRVVAPRLAPILAAHPDLVIELAADPRHASLLRGEADLAIRPSRFGEDSIVQRRAGRVAFALYASRAYLAQHGVPDPSARGAGHVVLAMGEDVGDAARDAIATLLPDARIAFRTNGREPMAALAAADGGLAFLPCVVGDAISELSRVPTRTTIPDRALWLGVHRDTRTIPRVKAVARTLAAELARGS